MTSSKTTLKIKSELDRSISGKSILQTLGLWIVMSIIVGMGSWYAANAVPSWKGGNVPLLLVLAESYILLPIVILMMYGGFTGMRDRVKLRYTSLSDMQLAVGVWVALTLFSALVYIILGTLTGSTWHVGLELIHSATDISRLPSAGIVAWLLILLRVFVLAGLAEELLFRGLLFGWLRGRFSAKTTIIITTLLFTAEHYYLVIFPVVIILGLATGWLRERTGSIVPSLVVHILTDATLFIIAAMLLVNHIV